VDTRTRLLLSLSLSSATFTATCKTCKTPVYYYPQQKKRLGSQRWIPSHAGTAQALERAVPLPAYQLTATR
jgi:hypothetical protein